jgi:hypothetical protein
VRIRLSFHSASSKLMLCTLSAIGHIHDSCSMSRRHLDDVSSSNHIPHPSQRKSALLSCLSLHFRQRQPAILGMSSLSISTGYFPHTRIPLLISCPFPRLFSLYFTFPDEARVAAALRRDSVESLFPPKYGSCQSGRRDLYENF